MQHILIVVIIEELWIFKVGLGDKNRVLKYKICLEEHLLLAWLSLYISSLI